MEVKRYKSIHPKREKKIARDLWCLNRIKIITKLRNRAHIYLLDEGRGRHNSNSVVCGAAPGGGGGVVGGGGVGAEREVEEEGKKT